MSQATVLRYGELDRQAKAWLSRLFGENASDNAEVRISLREPADSLWTSLKNDRRLTLIERKIERTITPDELLELEVLQEEMLDHVEKVAPIPMGNVRELYRKYVENSSVNDSV